jgi:oxygen-independent coproporphyrinogen-3 oxidase
MEFSLEANPETITIEKISAWQKAGVNRLSLGIQTFSDKYLKILGRIHTTRKSIATIKLVKKYFKNFNIDLMFGLPESVGHNTSLPARRFALAGGEPLLPLRMTKNKMKKGRLSKSGQTVKEFEADLKKAVSLKPAHISVYQLTPEPKTPLWKLLKNKQLQLPEEETLFKMYHLAINFLKKSGYQHYEISNFARPGRECRHNLAIWHFEPYLGLGPAAHSFLFNRRFANPADIKEYSRRRRPLFPVEKLPPKKLMSEFVFLGLRCLSGINLSDFRKLFHTELPEIYRTQLEKLKKQKLLKISPKKIRLTTKGIFLGNEVFQEFI